MREFEGRPVQTQHPFHLDLDFVPSSADGVSPGSGISPTNSNYTTLTSPSTETLVQGLQSLQRSYTEDDKDATPYQASGPGDRLPIVKSACLQCRGKKSRCSGQRPVCQTCTNNNLPCTWDADSRPGSSSHTAKRKSRSSGDANQQRRSKRSQGPPLQVRSACTRCQRRKAKCTGSRPACQFCLERDLECVYNVEDGSTRTEDLKKKLEESRGRMHDLDQLVTMMRNSSNQDSTMMLARLRLGDSLEDLFEAVRNESSPADSAYQHP